MVIVALWDAVYTASATHPQSLLVGSLFLWDSCWWRNAFPLISGIPSVLRKRTSVVCNCPIPIPAVMGSGRVARTQARPRLTLLLKKNPISHAIWCMHCKSGVCVDNTSWRITLTSNHFCSSQHLCKCLTDQGPDSVNDFGPWFSFSWKMFNMPSE